MSNPYNGSKHGKPGGKHRPSRKEDFEPTHKVSDTARASEAGIYNGHYTEIERVSTHIIPRRSLTSQQGLGRYSQQVETETIHGKQLDKKSGTLIKVTDQRVVWRSDRTLLRNDRVGSFGDGPGGTRFKRTTSKSKITRNDPEHQIASYSVVDGQATLDPVEVVHYCPECQAVALDPGETLCFECRPIQPHEQPTPITPDADDDLIF